MKKKRTGLSRKSSNAIFEGVLPRLLISLAEQGLLKEEHLSSRETLLRLVYEQHRKAIKKMRLGTALEETFRDSAAEAWTGGDKFVGIVLYVTAMEQYMNFIYRTMLQAKGLNEEEATLILRSASTEAKLFAMLPLLSGRRIPQRLATRLKQVFLIRNQIVHFKAVDGPLDSRSDSCSRIRAQIAAIPRLSLSRDFNLLTLTLWTALLETNNTMSLIAKASEMLLPHLTFVPRKLKQAPAKTKGMESASSNQVN